MKPDWTVGISQDFGGAWGDLGNRLAARRVLTFGGEVDKGLGGGGMERHRP